MAKFSYEQYKKVVGKATVKPEINVESVKGYLDNPNQYVFPFAINEKNGKTRTIITYNESNDGKSLRKVHELLAKDFEDNFAERNQYSYAYHKGIRCYNALEAHLKSNYFIKLDIHHFFESITLENFLDIYGEYFNKNWREKLQYLFYFGSLSIGFVTSPLLSDFYMKKFDNAVEEYLKDYPELHFSRYSDDIMISSESKDDDTSLEALFTFIKEQLKQLRLETNESKTKKIKLNLEKHNSFSFLGLNLSKIDEENNKVTISKRYILFILFLIAKQKRYKNNCTPLDNEIKSRVAYLAYNSEISFERFQKKHINIYGEPYNFIPKVLEKREVGQTTDTIKDYSEYKDEFEFNIHSKADGANTSGYQIKNGITLTKYLGKKEEVIIPDFVDIIGDYVFMGHKIKKVILGNNVKIIGNDAFRNSTIEEIVMNDSLRHIGNGAFQNCKNIKKVVIPSYIKYVSNNTFAESGLEEITLPEGLIKIKMGAFAQSNIQNINFPTTLEAIEYNAFTECTKLSRVDLSKTNITSLGVGAFSNCVQLKEAILPEGLSTIENNLFSNCSLLKEINIPAKVGYINNSAFSNCYSLSSIKVSDGVAFLSRKDNASIVKKNHELLFTLKDKIDEDIQIIGRGLFAGVAIKNIVIPEGVKIIKEDAFKGCLWLKSITLPESLEEIGNNAFEKCISLEEIVIPSKVKALPNGLFANCSNLVKVVMGEEVTSIGDNCFANDKKLSIKLPKELMLIGEGAFKNCYGIKDLYIPYKVKEIKKNAFIGMSKHLNSIKVDNKNLVYSSGEDNNILFLQKKGNLILGKNHSTIPGGIKSIGNYAFAYNSELEEIDLPETVTTIGESAFKGCTNLHKINLHYVSKIEKHAFENTPNLKDILLPNSLTHIEECAFLNSGLTSITLPNSLVKLDRKAFRGCRNVKDIHIPASYTRSISALLTTGSEEINYIEIDPDNSMYQCVDNKVIIIKEINNDPERVLFACDGVKEIPNVPVIMDMAFKGVKGLKEIVIPNKVCVIGSNAFENCPDLEKVTFKYDDDIEIKDNAFKNCPNLKEVVLPKLLTIISASLFYNCPNLKEVKIPEGVKVIGDRAFAYTGLEKVTIRKDLVNIGNDAFASTSLKDVIIEEGVKKLSYGLFTETKISNITLPNSLEAVPGNLFAGCKELTSIVIPDKVASIGSSSFSDCNSLKEVKLPDNLEIIEESTFYKCVNLENINFPTKLKEIKSFAFYHCHKLNVPAFNEGLESIFSNSFNSVDTLKDLALPSTLKYFNNSAFAYCPIESIKVSPGGMYQSNNNALTYHNKNAFNELILGCKNTTLDDSVNFIAPYAFNNIDSLVEVILPKNVTTISSNAFSDCHNIKRIILNDKLESVQSGAFDSNLCIDELKIPANTKYFGYLPKEVNKIAIDKNNILYSDFGINVFASKDGKILMTTPTSSLPVEGITSINRDCYNNRKFTKVELPSTLISLGGFNNCEIDELFIPDSVKTISLFAINSIIKKITVSENNPYYIASEDGTMILTRSKKQIVYLGENTVIPEGITIATTNDLITSIHYPSTISDGVLSLEPRGIKHIDIAKDHPTVAANNNTLYRKLDGSLIYAVNGEEIADEVTKITNLNLGKFDNVIIPKNVNLILPRALGGLIIDNIAVHKDNKMFDSRDNCNALIHTSTNTVLFIARNGRVPDGCVVTPTTIDQRVKDVTSIEIENNYSGYETLSYNVIQRLNNNPQTTTKSSFSTIAFDSDDDLPF